MEILATVQSLIQARRLLDEIAIQGKLKPAGFGEDSVVYEEDGLELTIIRREGRQWSIVKRQKGEEPGKSVPSPTS